MRRTKLQRDLHRRVIEEWLVEGLPAGQVVRSLVGGFGLTARQARYDLAQVQAGWRREDDAIRQNRRRLRDLAVAVDRAERDFRAALAAGDARLALRIEKHRSKLRGVYDADRRRDPHLPDAERQEFIQQVESDLDRMYADAPRNPDGSVVLTAYSRTPPPVADERYRRKIERPLARGPSPRRQERIADLRAALAAGVRIDQLEAAARERFGLSPRQIRSDVRLLEWQLEDDGHRIHQGTHDQQSLPLALRRRERIAELAVHPKPAERTPNPPAGGADIPVCQAGKNACPTSTKPTKPNHRLAADVEFDRCKLLGLYARERPNAEEDDLRWRPRDVGQFDNPSHAASRPRSAVERIDYDQDRMIEAELAFLDAKNGFRHSATELLPDLFGPTGHPGRQPWKPPEDRRANEAVA